MSHRKGGTGSKKSVSRKAATHRSSKKAAHSPGGSAPRSGAYKKLPDRRPDKVRKKV